MYAIYDGASTNGNGTDPEPSNVLVPLDLYALANDEIEESWLVDDIWPLGRQLHIHAARKTGKSLVALWMAANLAMGRDPFTQRAIEPKRVGYLDYEMTRTDLKRRLFDDMGFEPSQIAANLNYYLHPMLPMLDTAAGGDRLIENVVAHDEQVVIIDTMSRVIHGEENSNDTYINFYKYTGVKLKAHGVSLMRLDHEGHESGRSRGASAKADDVDVVWQLKESDGGLTFVRKASRISDVPENVALIKKDDPTLSFSRGAKLWPSGTIEKAKQLDAIGAPIDISQRKAIALLKEANEMVGKTTIVQAAIHYRKTAIMGV